MLLGAGAAVVACTGTSVTNTALCGPGTAPVQGECVIPDAATDGEGRDVDLALDAASATDSSGSVDAGTGEAPSSVADGSVPGADASTTDDPCPSGPIGINCSSECGGVSSGCGILICSEQGVDEVTGSELPFVIRTPSLPLAICNSCDSGPELEYLVFRGDFSSLPNGAMVTVGAPWTVGSTATGNGCAPGPASQCAVFTGVASVVVWTSDPTAPARNVELTAVSPGQQCP